MAPVDLVIAFGAPIEIRVRCLHRAVTIAGAVINLDALARWAVQINGGGIAAADGIGGLVKSDIEVVLVEKPHLLDIRPKRRHPAMTPDGRVGIARPIGQSAAIGVGVGVHCEHPLFDIVGALHAAA